MSKTEKRALRLAESPALSPTNEFHRSHAVIIGINDYGNGIPRLRTARADAERLAQILTDVHSYESTLMVDDVSAARLTTLLQDELPQKVDKNDRLLFYFAGHGIALDGEDGPAGYLVPQDADGADRTTFLPMQVVHDALDTLDCRHCLVILDCCFSGAFRWSSTRSLDAPPSTLYRERYERFLRSPAWQVLTSAAYDEEALDVLSGFSPREDVGQAHSPFALALFDALSGQGDANGDGVLVATELYLYLRDCVQVQAETLARHFQTPGIWPLKKHHKGEFIFLLGDPKLEPAPELTKKNNPYRGLKSYDAADAALFFGRSALVKQLATHIETNPLTVVLGASGTGKSSLVKAGVAPYLARAAHQTDAQAGTADNEVAQSTWHTLEPFRPTETPLRAFAELIAGQLPGNSKAPNSSDVAPYITQRITDWFTAHPNQKLLLIVDQFEELVTLCRDGAEREAFQQLLQTLLESHRDKLRIVLTLRTDFEPQFAESPLADHWQAGRFVVPPMTQADLREVIEGPASVRVLFFEPPELVDTLIDEVIQTPGALPLLSFTLEQLYLKYLERQEAAQAIGDTIERALTIADYDELGGVIGSLRTRADEEYKALPDDAHRATMERVMLRMVAMEGGELARRRVPMTELIYPNEGENQRVQEVINRLVDARLLVKDSADADGDGVLDAYVEPAHDALVRAWDRLLRWKQDFEEFLSLQRTLTAAADEWTFEGSEPKSGLLWNNNPRLPQLQSVLFPDEFGNEQKNNFVRTARQSLWPPTRVTKEPTWLNRQETEFVRSSVVRRANVLKRVVGITLGVIVILSGLTLFAFDRQQEAVAQTGLANQRAEAEATARADAEIQEANAVREATIAQSREWATKSSLAFQNEHIVPSLLTAAHAVSMSLTLSPTLYLPSVVQALRTSVQNARVHPLPFAGHDGSIFDLVFSPDGQWLATAGFDKTIHLWKVNEFEPRPIILRGHEGWIKVMTFSPDGKWLATAGGDRTVLLWQIHDANIENIKPIVLPVDHSWEVGSLTFSPDGEWLASFGQYALLWRVDNPHAEPVNLRCDHGWITASAFSPDGQWLVTGSEQNTACLLAIHNPDFGPHILRGHQSDISALAFSPDSRWLATAGTTALLWEIDDTDAEPVQLSEHTEPIRVVAFSPDGNKLATAGEDDIARIWEISASVNPNPFYSQSISESILDGHTGNIVDLVFGPNGKWLATASEDATARLWQVPTPGTWSAGTPEIDFLTLRGHEGPLTTLSFSPDGKWLATGSEDTTARVWEVNLDVEPLIYTHTVSFGAQLLGPNGRWAATNDILDKSKVQIWQVEDPDAEPIVLNGNEVDVQTLAMDAKGQWLATVGEETNIQLWQIDTLDDAPRNLNAHAAPVIRMAFSPDSDQLVTASEDSTVYLWQIKDPIPRPQNLSGHKEEVVALAFSSDSLWLATASKDEVRIWQTNDPNAKSIVLHNDEGIFRTIAISPNARWLATANSAQKVRLWQLDGGHAEPITLPREDKLIDLLVFSPDNEWLATASRDSAVHLWHIDDPYSDPIVLYEPDSDESTDTFFSNEIMNMFFTHEGKQLVTRSSLYTQRWRIEATDLIEFACKRAERNMTWEEWTRYFASDKYLAICPEQPVPQSVRDALSNTGL